MTKLKFDKRIAERNIKHGIITREEYNEHLATLPDASDNVASLNARLERVFGEGARLRLTSINRKADAMEDDEDDDDFIDDEDDDDDE